MKRILNIIIIILLSAICLTGTAQKIAVKSNLLGWATATPTLGAEIGLDDRWTLNTHIYYNPFTFRDNRKWKHIDRKSTRLNSSHRLESRMPSSA